MTSEKANKLCAKLTLDLKKSKILNKILSAVSLLVHSQTHLDYTQQIKIDLTIQLWTGKNSANVQSLILTFMDVLFLS